MLAAPSRDWSVFQQIFADHWEPFQRAHPRYQTAYYDDLVAKMLDCGNPEKMGYLEYRCLQCGEGTHVVAMSCKSSLCLRCAKVSVDNWVSQVSRVLHEGVIYRHIILTVPAMFRTTFGFVANFAQEVLKGQLPFSRRGLCGQGVELFGRSEPLVSSLDDHLFFLDHVHEFDADECGGFCTNPLMPSMT